MDDNECIAGQKIQFPKKQKRRIIARMEERVITYGMNVNIR